MRNKNWYQATTSVFLIEFNSTACFTNKTNRHSVIRSVLTTNKKKDIIIFVQTNVMLYFSGATVSASVPKRGRLVRGATAGGRMGRGGRVDLVDVVLLLLLLMLLLFLLLLSLSSLLSLLLLLLLSFLLLMSLLVGI